MPDPTRSFAERLPLARAALDRDAASRARPIGELRSEPRTRIAVVHEGRALMSGDEGLALLDPAELPSAALELFLGRTTGEDAGRAVLAALVDDATADRLASVPGRSFAGLRDAGPVLGTRDAGIFTEALALANWHAAYGFAPRSGRATEVRHGGWMRVDPETGTEFFPRTDAAIIVGVTDREDRILLGSNALWPTDRFSVLAGFVEPGESLEQAVIREVAEESGIAVAEPRYLGSQPWPFPASLMVGFRATVAEGTPRDAHPVDAELRELRWFTRDELTSAVQEEGLRLPGAASIARAIIEDWHGGDIGSPDW